MPQLSGVIYDRQFPKCIFKFQYNILAHDNWRNTAIVLYSCIVKNKNVFNTENQMIIYNG